MKKTDDKVKSADQLMNENQNLKEALKQVLYQNEMLLTWVQGAIVTVNREGIVISANDRAQAAHGCVEPDGLIGEHYHENYHHTLEDGGEYPWEYCPVFAAIEDGSSHHLTNETFWKLDRTPFLVDCIVCPKRNENNEISGATITFRNLTEMKLQENKRVHGLKLESIGELSAGIAHEINTPIQFIGSNLSFLQEVISDTFTLIERFEQLSSVNDENMQKNLSVPLSYAEEIDLEYLKEEAPKAVLQTISGIERVSELVQGLKRFAHSGDEKGKEPVDINEIVENSLIVCKNSYKYAAELHLDLKSVDKIEGNPGDLGQVLVNLLVNSAHAVTKVKEQSNEMGTISIKSYQDDHNVFVEVKDTGSGIPEELKNKVFDPFFTTKDVGEGSGQGLAISRTIINEKHNGELFLEESSSNGTTFKIQLPKTKKVAPEA